MSITWRRVRADVYESEAGRVWYSTDALRWCWTVPGQFKFGFTKSETAAVAACESAWRQAKEGSA